MCEYIGIVSVFYVMVGFCIGVQGYIFNVEIQEYKNVNDINVVIYYD